MAPVQRDGVHHLRGCEMRGERVGQAHQGGKLRAEQAGPQNPHLDLRAVTRRRAQGQVQIARKQRAQFDHIVGEILRTTVNSNHWEDRDVEIIYCGTRLRKDGPFKASSAELDAYIEKLRHALKQKLDNGDTLNVDIW